MAMRESGSSDLFVLARLALESAVRSHADLLELLNDPVPRSAPVKPAAIEAVAIA
jgi:hypothetical protein